MYCLFSVWVFGTYFNFCVTLKLKQANSGLYVTDAATSDAQDAATSDAATSDATHE